MKKIIMSLIAVFALLTGVVGCSSGSDEKLGTNGDVDVTIEEQVIYDEHDIKVTASGLDFDDIWGPSIEVLIENNSKKDVTVQADYCIVNDLMTDTMFSSDVASGKKANDTITMLYSDLELEQLNDIQEIELVLNIIDTDTYDTLYQSKVINLKTNTYQSSEFTFDDSGEVAYEDDNYKIVVKKLDSEDSFWGADIYLYLENNSKKDVTIQTENVSINGFMVDPLFSCDVHSGKKAISSITFFESDLEDNNIEDITELELKFNILNSKSYNTIKETKTIKLNFD